MSSRNRAIVIGGGLAGLAAARALARAFAEVTLFEQGEAPQPDEPRRHAPQGAHLHYLVCGGVRALDQLFPGICDEMEADGLTATDAVADAALFLRGAWKQSPRSDMLVYPQTRPFLETRLHRWVRALGNVRIEQGVRVRGPVWEAQRRRCVGVILTDGRVEPADLVVDAAGRSSRQSSWLREAGFEAPRTERVAIDLGYATRLYRGQAESLPWRIHFQGDAPERHARGGYVFQVERNQWIVTLSGYQGDHPPADPAGFEAFARALPTPAIQQALAVLDPIGEVATYRYESAVWHRYDALAAPPPGLVALGDAVCSLDPKFGHGMSKALQEAVVLARLLAAGTPSDVLPRQFYREALPYVRSPWTIMAIEDFRIPGVTGDRPPLLGPMQRLVDAIVDAATDDADLLRCFVEVIYLVRPHTALARPGVLARLLRRRLRRAFGRLAPAPAPRLPAAR
jgi:2-polyprenyl-6-methoxyphenol hydroxylase-like FAD-dependent oxidoreductase